MFSDDPTETLHRRVLDWMRTAIITGYFEAGSRIKQTDVAKLLGVSPTPVREAMRDLHAEALLTLSAQKSGIVRTIDVNDVEEIRTMTRLLEPQLAALAAERITADELVVAKRMQAEMEATDDEEVFFAQNRRFHAFLYGSARSPRLGGVMRSLHDSFPDYMSFSYSRIDNRRRDALEEHRVLLRALEERDPEAASAVMRIHWEPVLDELEKAVSGTR